MLTVKSVRTLNVSDYQLQTVQDQLVGAISSVVSQPILDGNLVPGVAVTANKQFLLSHSLGRNYRGYFVTRTQGSNNMVLLREVAPATAKSDPKKIVALVPSATATIDIWVF